MTTDTDTLREALENTTAWLEGPQLGTWPYLESEYFYADKRKHIEANRLALTTLSKPEPAAVGEGRQFAYLHDTVEFDHPQHGRGHFFTPDCIKELPLLVPTPTSEAISPPDAPHWQPMTNTAWLDGRDVELLAHDMVVSARYCGGEWTAETPVQPREYSGAVWSCFDDQFQFEIEEVSKDAAEWCHGPVKAWRMPTIQASSEPCPPDARAVVEACAKALERIAQPLDCGCVPCVGQCRSQVALECEVEERQEIARQALASLQHLVADDSELRCRIQDALLATLGNTYDCNRVWAAWGVGTMDQDDFVPVLDRLEELVDEIFAALQSGASK